MAGEVPPQNASVWDFQDIGACSELSMTTSGEVVPFSKLYTNVEKT